MSEVEEMLRQTLTRAATGAPTGRAMLTQVRHVARRRQNRHRAAVAISTALTLTLAGVATITIADHHRAVPTAPLATHGSPVFTSAAGTTVGVTFPVTPIAPLLNDGAPILTLTAGQPTLTYSATSAGGISATVTASSTPLADGKPVRFGSMVASIGGRPTSDGLFVQSWPAGDGRWIDISTPKPAPPAVVAKYAGALADRPFSRPGPFTFDLQPAGYSVDNVNARLVTFCPPGVAPDATVTGKIAVMLLGVQSMPSDARTEVVAGKRAWTDTAHGVTTIAIDQSDDQWVRIQVPIGLHVTETDLLRFAAGVNRFRSS